MGRRSVADYAIASVTNWNVIRGDLKRLLILLVILAAVAGVAWLIIGEPSVLALKFVA